MHLRLLLEFQLLLPLVFLLLLPLHLLLPLVFQLLLLSLDLCWVEGALILVLLDSTALPFLFLTTQWLELANGQEMATWVFSNYKVNFQFQGEFSKIGRIFKNRANFQK